ncbi:alpha-glucuronidase family glycosyl hydrolase [Clostridium hydrogenum]|uniref:alpha-glucuronidase family glycosyl hydrolase n=1 Tax=Clostridium hydrogenum TaxID=2855764 RepID=UPI001F31F4B2|nr:alpha-glucuronidase family glycosyl hydrolase [Clostridium hydrogenum]
MDKVALNKSVLYKCWLNYDRKVNLSEESKEIIKRILVEGESQIIDSAVKELKMAVQNIIGEEPKLLKRTRLPHVFLGISTNDSLGIDGFEIKRIKKSIKILGNNESGILYGVFSFIRKIYTGVDIGNINIEDSPKNMLRMINHWDNISGDIERGYAGKSIFFKDNHIVDNTERINEYARLAASISINGIVINNVNVHEYETKLISDEYLTKVGEIANIFTSYGIKLYLSINFASPIELGGLKTADPLDVDVKLWWKERVKNIYKVIPNFGGFLVKADSEFRPGPFTYGRNHADGANMLAEALEPFGGIVIWRCFVYNCLLDWRDRSKDRAKAAYENFKPLDGKFKDNVILQVKNGPMDFQIREPISPLFGAMKNTNEMIEFQITQEYTGQQKHLCYLVPLWKEVLDFDTFVEGRGSTVSNIVNGSLFERKYGGAAAVANIGDDESWTGHPLAQANFYGYGRLVWDTSLSSEEIAKEWVELTFGIFKEETTIISMLAESRDIYEEYTCPLGIGWMVNPNNHYGPSVDGYEYSRWGTYHYADYKSLGVDRTTETGTGYTGQYSKPIKYMFENLQTCPEELLLFFHNMDYKYVLKSRKTIIQHIYDTHFEGVEKVFALKEKWISLKGKINEDIFNSVIERLNIQIKDSEEWRDVVNSYFYRKTGIDDELHRKIY